MSGRTVRFGDLHTVGGHLVGEVTSALQKEIQRGHEREALHWATELALTGYTNYVWKRLRIIASEDVGLGEPMMAVLVRDRAVGAPSARSSRTSAATAGVTGRKRGFPIGLPERLPPTSRAPMQPSSSPRSGPPRRPRRRD